MILHSAIGLYWMDVAVSLVFVAGQRIGNFLFVFFLLAGCSLLFQLKYTYLPVNVTGIAIWITSTGARGGLREGCVATERKNMLVE